MVRRDAHATGMRRFSWHNFMFVPSIVNLFWVQMASGQESNEPEGIVSKDQFFLLLSVISFNGCSGISSAENSQNI